MELLVIGSVALDTVETPVERRAEILGGSASFVSVAARRFTPVSIVAVVGDDFPGKHRQLLLDQGVDLGGLQVTAGRTFRWSGRYRQNMNLRDTLSTELGVFEDFVPVLNGQAQQAKVIFLANIHPCLQLKVLEEANQPHFVGLDTMNYWIEGTPELLTQVLRKVDLLLINEEEARALSGDHSLPAAARKILEMGPRYLVVKRGEYGALLFWNDGVFSIPALLLEHVKDPTGAGDTFAGGFMGYLAREEDFSPRTMRRAMVMGTVMASFAVEDFSLDGLLQTTGEDIKRRHDELVTFFSLEA